jgi:hypothetical protein
MGRIPMSDTRDIRENTRALIRLERAIEALNRTLVEIERGRHEDAAAVPGALITEKNQ